MASTFDIFPTPYPQKHLCPTPQHKDFTLHFFPERSALIFIFLFIEIYRYKYLFIFLSCVNYKFCFANVLFYKSRGKNILFCRSFQQHTSDNIFVPLNCMHSGGGGSINPMCSCPFMNQLFLLSTNMAFHP